jgi:hypothetical protein
MFGFLDGTGINRDELSDAEKKWYDLRNAGYDGWVDHNGNAVEDLDQWIKDHSLWVSGCGITTIPKISGKSKQVGFIALSVRTAGRSWRWRQTPMRIDNILIQPIDAADGEYFVIMDESSGAEIELSKAKLIRLNHAIIQLLG